MNARISIRWLGVAVLLAVAAPLGCGGSGDDDGPNPEIYEDINIFDDNDTGTTTDSTDNDNPADDVAVDRPDAGRSDANAGVDDATTKPVDEQFSGWWATADGEGEAECNGQSLSIDGGPEGRIEAASDDRLRFHTEQGDCTFRFALSGRTATLESGQSCERTEDGTTETVEPSEWTLTLKPGEQRLEQTYRAEATRTENGQTLTCQANWDGTLEPGVGPKAFVDEFVGTWANEDAGSKYNVSCSKDHDETSLEELLGEFAPVGRGVRIEEGDSTDLEVTTSYDAQLESDRDGICTWSLTADRRAATVDAGATCAEYVPLQPEKFPPRTVETSTFELSEDGESLTHEYRGTLSGSVDGQPIECTERWTVTYQRSDKN